MSEKIFKSGRKWVSLKSLTDEQIKQLEEFDLGNEYMKFKYHMNKLWRLYDKYKRSKDKDKLQMVLIELDYLRNFEKRIPQSLLYGTYDNSFEEWVDDSKPTIIKKTKLIVVNEEQDEDLINDIESE